MITKQIELHIEGILLCLLQILIQSLQRILIAYSLS